VLEFHVLGSLTILRDGASLTLGGFRQRAVLGALIAHANEVIPPHRLIDLVWTDPPATAEGTLYNYISRLRSAFDRRAGGGWELLKRHEGGYALHVDPETIDVRRFERRIARARRLRRDGLKQEASGAYCQAFAEWSGPPFAGFDSEPFATPFIARFDQLYIGASIELAKIQLDLGRASVALERLQPLVCERPLDGSLRLAHAQALLDVARPADALRSLDSYRSSLMEEAGMNPGDEVEELRLRVLRNEVRGPRSPQRASRIPG
jgi:DNA-binding SARP family transcriptional activator